MRRVRVGAKGGGEWREMHFVNYVQAWPCSNYIPLLRLDGVAYKCPLRGGGVGELGCCCGAVGEATNSSKLCQETFCYRGRRKIHVADIVKEKSVALHFAHSR